MTSRFRMKYKAFRKNADPVNEKNVSQWLF